MPGMEYSVSVISAPENRPGRTADDGDQGDQGVAERMVIDDLALGQTLGPGRADEVSVEHLQHVGAGVTHEGTDTDNHQGDDGQNQMMSHVQELREG